MAFLSLKILCANLNKMCPNIFCTFLRLNIVLLRSLILSTQIKPELTSEFYELFKNDFNEKSAILNPLSILIILCHQYFQPSPFLFFTDQKVTKYFRKIHMRKCILGSILCMFNINIILIDNGFLF